MRHSSRGHVRAGTHVREAKRRIAADVVVGLLMTAFFIVACDAFERTSTGEFLEESVYDFLQLRLSSKLDASSLQVLVVDIGDMKMDRDPVDRRRDFTNRDELQALVEKIGAHHPAAIALDTDFTPYANQREQDRRFLDFCLNLAEQGPNGGNRRLPVFVGLHEAVALGPDLCLTEPRFASLAAFVGFPNVREEESRKWMVESVAVPYEEEATHAQKIWNCPSLSAAVTDRRVKPAPRWIRWAIEDVFVDEESLPRVTEASAAGIGQARFLIDYSPLEALEKNSIPSGEIEAFLQDHSIEGKYILIGRGLLSRDTGDKYPVPGRRANAHPGVYVHASAADTLLRGPLWEITDFARLLIDIVFSLASILGLAAIRLRRLRRGGQPEDDRLSLVATTAVITVTVAVGFVTVNITRLMWSDFLLVALSEIVDYSFESHIEPFTDRVAALMPLALFRR
jgi:CHASE2 domain-containing sensor protein